MFSRTQTSWKSLWPRLLVAVGLVAVATPLARLADAHLTSGAADAYLIAVVLAAFVGGFPAALLATVLSTLSLDFFTLSPRYEFHLADTSHWLHAAAFFIVALVVSSLYSATRNSERHVQELLEGERESKGQLEALTGELQAANEVKDEFIGLVSHELKTPLTTVIVNAHYLRRTADLSGESGLVLDELQSEASRLAAIIDNLLILARLDRGEELTLEPVVIARVVKRVVLRHQVEHPARQFRLDLDASVIAHASSVSLEQVVQNLLSNAEKYSPADRPVGVTVRAAGGEAVVEIVDAGPGVSDVDAPHVFDPFYRSKVTAQRVSGIGVGLAVCKRLIEAESGRIWLETGERGSTFAFALPLLDASALPSPDMPRRALRTGGASPRP